MARKERALSPEPYEPRPYAIIPNHPELGLQYRYGGNQWSERTACEDIAPTPLPAWATSYASAARTDRLKEQR